MKYKTNCKMYDEEYLGNPGPVPYCKMTGTFEPDCEKCTRPNYTNGDYIRSMNDYDLAEWICKILTFCSNKGINECSSDCPLYKCCNDQPTDNIEGWLKSSLEEK